jgi:hypothetical protein
MRSDDRVEELMDEALRSYAEGVEVPETRVAIARVMERARVLEARTQAWVWAVVVPAIVCLLAVVAVGAAWLIPGSRVAEIAWVPKAPGVVSGTEGISPGSGWYAKSSRGSASESRARKSLAHQDGAPGIRLASAPSSAQRLPKMAVFPTPRPLTPEEQALLVFAAQASPAAKKEVIEAERHLGDPIVIAELKIDPLDDKSRE